MNSKTVIHKKYGEGNVIEIKNGFITVAFTGETKTFIFPDCFENVLTTSDQEFSDLINMSINNRNAEKSIKLEKGLKRRIPGAGRRPVSSWQSTFIPKRQEHTAFKKIKRETKINIPSEPSVKKKDSYKRYNGRNAFVVVCNSTFQDEQNNSCTIISKYDSEGNPKPYLGSALYVKENDILFHVFDYKLKSFSSVTENVIQDDTDYIINSQYIPVMGDIEINTVPELADEIKAVDPKLEKGIIPISLKTAKIFTQKINSVCPYISGIEGINEFL